MDSMSAAPRRVALPTRKAAVRAILSRNGHRAWHDTRERSRAEVSRVQMAEAVTRYREPSLVPSLHHSIPGVFRELTELGWPAPVSSASTP